MLIKINVSNVSITNTVANNTNDTNESTTLKVENLSLEEEVKQEEISALMDGITDAVKELITSSKKNTNSDKRYNITKYKIDGSWECQRYHQYTIIQDRKNNSNKIMFIFENGDCLTRDLTNPAHLKMYNKEKYITEEYDSDVIEL